MIPQGCGIKYKNEFKKRLYNWVLRLIKFIDKLPKDSVYYTMGKQLVPLRQNLPDARGILPESGTNYGTEQ